MFRKPTERADKLMLEQDKPKNLEYTCISQITEKMLLCNQAVTEFYTSDSTKCSHEKWAIVSEPFCDLHQYSGECTINQRQPAESRLEKAPRLESGQVG